MASVIAPEDCAYMITLAIAFMVVSAFLLLLGVFNNVLILHIIISNGQQMRTLPNIFIANMAVLGLFYLAIVNGGPLVAIGQVAFQVEIITDASVESYLFSIQVVSNSSQTFL